MHSQFRITTPVLAPLSPPPPPPTPLLGPEMFLAQKQLRSFAPPPPYTQSACQRSDNEAAAAIGREIKLRLFIYEK